MASTISWLIWLPPAVVWSGTRFERRMPRERDLDLARVRRSMRTRRSSASVSVAGEAALALDRLARANPDPAAQEAAEVLGLGQRPVGPRRGDLERLGREQVAQLVGDALAERQVDAVRVVDVEPQRLGGRALERDQLDARARAPQACSRSALEARPNSSLSCSMSCLPHPASAPKKRRARAHLSQGSGAKRGGLSIASARARGKPGAAHAQPAGRRLDQASSISVTGPSLTSSTAIRAPNTPRSRAEPLAEALVERLGDARAGAASVKLGPVALAGVAVERELAHAEDLAVAERLVHPARRRRRRSAARGPCRRAGRPRLACRPRATPEQDQQPGADRGDLVARRRATDARLTRWTSARTRPHEAAAASRSR